MSTIEKLLKEKDIALANDDKAKAKLIRRTLRKKHGYYISKQEGYAKGSKLNQKNRRNGKAKGKAARVPQGTVA